MENISSPFCKTPADVKMLSFSYPSVVCQRAGVYGQEVKHDRFSNTWAAGHASHDTYSVNGDLLSLAWLQKGNILQIAPLDSEEDNTCTRIAEQSSQNNGDSTSTIGHSDLAQRFVHLCDRGESQISPSRSVSLVSCAKQSTAAVVESSYADVPSFSRSFGGRSLPYSCQGLTKPSYSYTHLIFMAIESTPLKCMTVNQIYNWCEAHFPFYKHAGAGWKNSLRHNLSINKSFKRLPRDGRGPGRGAYWAVEPRERPNLLDALKRNPWNSSISQDTNVATYEKCTANGELCTFSVSNPFDTLTDAQRYNGTSSSINLGSSAPAGLFHTAALCATFPDGGSLSSSLSSQSSIQPTQRITSSDGRTIFPENLIALSMLGDAFSWQNVISASRHDINSESDCGKLKKEFGLSLETSLLSGCGAADSYPSHLEPKWSSDEEEKYKCTLRLLLETSSETFYSKLQGTGQFSENAGEDSTSHPSFTKFSSSLGHRLADVNSKGCGDSVNRSATKQRRKSRLHPTVDAEDQCAFSDISRHLKNMLGSCNECKENETSGCENCQLRCIRFLSLTPNSDNWRALFALEQDDNLMADSPLGRLLDSLDSDQERGPAGGPALKRKNAAQNAVPQDDAKDTKTSDGCGQSSEVFVTPAPYLDHEYCHCQKQLRRPDEARLVEKYNVRYRRSRQRFIRNLRYRLCGRFTGPEDAKPLRKRQTRADGYSTPVFDEMKDVYMDETQGSPSAYHLSVPPEKVVETELRNGKPITARNSSASSTSSTECDVFPICDHPQRLQFYRRASPLSGLDVVSRRSTRKIKAPKRPYDDFEFFSKNTKRRIDLNGKLAASSESNKLGQAYLSLNNIHGHVLRKRRCKRKSRIVLPLSGHRDASEAAEGSQLQSTVSSQMVNATLPKRRGRRKMTYNVRGSATDVLTPNNSSSEIDEELTYVVSSECSRNSSRDRSSGTRLLAGAGKRSISRNRLVRGVGYCRSSHSGIDSDSGTSDVHFAMDNDSCSESDRDRAPLASPGTPCFANEDDYEQTYDSRADTAATVVEVNNVIDGEKTTVEAAQLLMGISQMQNFRRQSGYVSLDSSGTSSSPSHARKSFSATSLPDENH